MSATTSPTLERFREHLLTVDPKLKRYVTMREGDYTCWHEYGARGFAADNVYDDRIWRIQVDRLTKIEDDPLVPLITAALDCDWITHTYDVDYDRETGYIHHIWDCEVI